VLRRPGTRLLSGPEKGLGRRLRKALPCERLPTSARSAAVWSLSKVRPPRAPAPCQAPVLLRPDLAVVLPAPAECRPGRCYSVQQGVACSSALAALHPLEA